MLSFNEEDQARLNETAKSNDFNIEITYNKSIKTAIRSKFSFVSINYLGEKNTAVQYAMLNGLQNEQNFLWGLTD